MGSNITTAVECEPDLFYGVNMVKDWEILTDLEKKYLPGITAKKASKKADFFEVTISTLCKAISLESMNLQRIAFR